MRLTAQKRSREAVERQQHVHAVCTALRCAKELSTTVTASQVWNAVCDLMDVSASIRKHMPRITIMRGESRALCGTYSYNSGITIYTAGISIYSDVISTLAHEMCHAIQFELANHRWAANYLAGNADYWRNPDEIEARAIASRAYAVLHRANNYWHKKEGIEK